MESVHGECRLPGRLSGWDLIVLSHLQLGHTRLTHSYQMNGEHGPRSGACGFDVTVEDILVECGEVRQRQYDADDFSQLLQEINVTDIFGLLHEFFMITCEKILILGLSDIRQLWYV